MLADRPSATPDNAGGVIILDFDKGLTSEQRTTAEPGLCYYLGPLVYRGADEHRYCPGTVYGGSCPENELVSRSYPLYYTESVLREITLPPLFSN